MSACGYSGNSIHCNVRALAVDGSNASWSTLQPIMVTAGALPAGRYGFAFAWDAETERLIAASGGRFPTAQDQVNAAPDTWALELGREPAVWRKLAEHPEGSARNGCFALDPVGHRLFVWGGTATGATTVPGLRVLELEPGRESWKTLSLENSPPERSSCSAVYDAKRHRILFGFGNSSTGIYADLHALEL